jgi:restriction endonuclease S subunit
MTEGALVALGESLPPATSQTGWRKVRFGDVVRNVNNNVRELASAGIERVVGLEHLDPESLHIRRWASSADGPTFTRLFKPGQVLFGKRRAYQRKVAVAEFEGACSGDILVFEPASGDLMPELLPFIVQSDGFFEHALGTSAGSLSPRTRWQDLAAYEFDLPPLAEQRRIAALLWAADEVIVRFAATAKAIDDWLESQINYLLDNKNSVGSVKENKLGELAQIGSGLTINPERQNKVVQAPYLRVANVSRGKISLSDVKTTGVEESEISRFALQDQDVLIVEGHANPNEVGRCAIWDGSIDTCLHQNHLFRVRCGARLHPLFLTAYVNSHIGRRYFRKHAKSSSGLYTINSRVVSEMPIQELPIEMQTAFVEVTSQGHNQRAQVMAHIDFQESLKKTLMRTLLTKECQ